MRGKDLEWVKIDKFENEESYRKSEIKKKLFENLFRRKNRNFEYGVVENIVCKYARKVGYQPCPLKYKVTFFSTSFDVTVESNDVDEMHIHEVKKMLKLWSFLSNSDGPRNRLISFLQES